LNENGEWTGITINKAYIICTKEDIEAREDQITSTNLSLPEPKPDPVDEIIRRKKIKEYLDKIWYTLKKKNLFEGYETPDDYRKAKGLL
jgi:hypothetical protein